MEESDKNVVAAEEGALQPSEVGGAQWKTDDRKGLTAEQVSKSRELLGDNDIPTHSTPTWMLFAHQFIGFMPILIIIALIISFGLGDWQDGIILLALLLINACLGFRDEMHAKKSLEELSGSLESEVTVVRGGESKALPVSELVTGKFEISCRVLGAHHYNMRMDARLITRFPFVFSGCRRYCHVGWW
jgi:magnesium-transporting ATPase (P-type)